MIETTGRTLKEAVAKAIAELGIRESDAEVQVIEERRARFLGLFGGPVVRVRVGRRNLSEGSEEGADYGPDVERVSEIVTGILGAMGVEAKVRPSDENAHRRVVIETGGSDGLLIGRHGQTIAAIEHIANRILTRCRDNRPVVRVDVGDYRSRQPEEDAATRGSRAASRSAGTRGRSGRRARAGAR